MGVKEGCNYKGDGRLLPNYGWVQNTSNLSLVRDMVELLDKDGMNHYDFMRVVYQYRTAKEPNLAKWTYDARCRARAIVATGMATLDRRIQGYQITDLGTRLLQAPKSDKYKRNIRLLTEEEIEIFREGILSNPPVVQVLQLLNDNRRNKQKAMSKYDLGQFLGFAGDPGFTHLEPEAVARRGASFNDQEGDADKWARTILSWLIQVKWVKQAGYVVYYGKRLPVYTTVPEVDRVLRYKAKSIVKYVPEEMLCSDKQQLKQIVRKRRFSILQVLSDRKPYSLEMIKDKINSKFEIDIEKLHFELTNLIQAGFKITKEDTYYQLADNLLLDEDKYTALSKTEKEKQDDIEAAIEKFSVKYEDTIPARLIDSLIRYGCAGHDNCTDFEGAVSRFFTFIGYETDWLGQGNGRVADVLAKYRDEKPPRSYGIIIDAKAYKKYNFNAADRRKMKEYIGLHFNEFLQQSISKAAFAFISMDFVPEESALKEIAEETVVDGTAIDVYTLLELGNKVRKQEVSISKLYSSFCTNKRYSVL